MAVKYRAVKYGDFGDDVLQVQKRLNDSGYRVAQDGIFGNETRQAVQAYQSGAGLTPDGIVGDKTRGSLVQTASTGATPGAAPQNVSLDDIGNSKPGDYQSKNQGMIDELYNQIVNRQPFQFTLSGNPLWDQYRDSYTRMGRMAMQDTMGQAAGLTGGYGSSYGQNVGQQAYNRYMQELNNIIPELYAQERSAYEQDTQRMMDRLSLLQSQEDRDYAIWADAYDRWFQEWQAAQGQANWEKEMAQSQENWEKEMSQSQENWEKEWEYRTSLGSGTGGSRGSYSSSGGGGSAQLQIPGHLYELVRVYVDEEGGGAYGVQHFLKSAGYGDKYIDPFWELCQEYMAEKKAWQQEQTRKNRKKKAAQGDNRTVEPW